MKSATKQKENQQKLQQEKKMESSRPEILVLPFFGQGHLFPCMELCKRLSTYHNCKSILVIPSNLSSSVPTAVRRHPFLEVIDIPNPPPSEEVQLEFGSGHPHPFHGQHKKLGEGIEMFLAERYNQETGSTRPVCAVIDVMMSWSKEFFEKFGLPIVSFFTSGACSSAIDYAGWVAKVEEMKPGQTRIFDGLPTNMGTVSYSELKLRHQRHRPPPGHSRNLSGPPTPDGLDRPEGGRPRAGPHGPGGKPRWLEEVEGSIAMFFNTCEDIDGPFISYLSHKIDKPVYGIGPLLPEHYWKSFDTVIHDTEVRSNRVSNYTEDQVVQWLDKKPSQSVIYVSFGSEVGPSMDEYDELAHALEETNRSFIWVIQPNSGIPGHPPGFDFDVKPASQPKDEGYYPTGLDNKVGDRGLIIRGWAPQLLILSHRSISGFISHCGWNSTVEAIGRGVPILAWPIRGDQFHNANLVVNHLKVGHHLLKNDDGDNNIEEIIMVKKSEIMKGIDLLMDDKEAHMHAMALRSKFKNGFPSTSMASLKSFLDAQVI